MDVQEYRDIYTKFHPLEIPVDWNIELIIILKQFIIFQSNYAQKIKKNDGILKFKLNEEKHSVFLLGLTQIGKSTFASILDDYQQLVIGQDEDQNYIYKQKNQEPVFRINQSFFSNSERIIKYKQIENFIINDCPGLNDTFEDFRIINALNIQNQINHYKSQIIIIALDCSNKRQFIQSFIETINCLRIFNQNFVKTFQSKIVLLLSKHPENDLFDNEFRTLLLQQPDLQNYKEDLGIFLELLCTNRFIRFYQARYEANLQQLKNQVIYVLNQRIQPNYDLNNQFQPLIQINNQDQFIRILKDLQNFIQIKINFFAQFICKDLINKIQFDMQTPLKEKKKMIKSLQKKKIIQSQLSFQQFYDQLNKWCKDSNYNLSRFQISELNHLQQLESNYQLKIIISTNNEQEILKKTKEIITTILRTKTLESVAINVAGLAFGGVVAAGGIGLELLAQGGREILIQVTRRVFFGLASVAMAQFFDKYNPEDYNDNSQLLDECFSANIVQS